MRFFRILALFFIVVAIGLWILDFGLRRYLGGDVDEIHAQSGLMAFEAKRDSLGVWSVKTRDEASLWFAVGYLQAHDREFQTELMRMLSRGRLSEWLGESLLSTDRLNRAIARVAKKEWDAVPEEDLSKRAARAYVEGRNVYLNSTKLAMPVEYHVLQIDRKSLDRWEPWEVFAINRIQAWQHSFDLGADLMSKALETRFKPEQAKILNERFRYPESALYFQKDVSAFVNQKLGGKSTTALWSSQNLLGSDRSDALSSNNYNFPPLRLDFQDSARFGASNLWILKKAGDPQIALCNDTHLMFSWPTPLYPIQYEIEGLVKARGFTLPGTVPLVIGTIESLSSETKDIFSWGITLAAFADTQDLIELSMSDLKQSETYEEEYKWIDTKTLKRENKKFKEIWTKWGPRVDEYLKSYGILYDKPIALDWVGFRSMRPASNFFLKRMIVGSKDIKYDLADLWEFPSVNFLWAAHREKRLETGHVLTGTIFERNENHGKDSFINTQQASLRKLSNASQRPYLFRPLDISESFFINTSNQSVFKDDKLNHRLARSWVPGARSEQILKNQAAIEKNVSFSQKDFTVPFFSAFIQKTSKVNPQSICKAQGNPQLCLDVLYGLSKWDFIARPDSWETTIAALWVEKVKQRLWGYQEIFKDENSRQLYEKWASSYVAIALLENLIKNSESTLRFENVFQLNFDTLLVDSFKESFDILSTQIGTTKEDWKWSMLHRIKWLHPFARYPAPLNELLMTGMLGKPRSVPGAIDSPGRFQYEWSPTNSLDFPSTHGAVMRTCSTINSDKHNYIMDWSMVSGVSGRPYSKWAWTMSDGYYQ